MGVGPSVAFSVRVRGRSTKARRVFVVGGRTMALFARCCIVDKIIVIAFAELEEIVVSVEWLIVQGEC